VINELREKIPASNLQIGMFVSELDRPWLGTPFLLEGVLIEEQSQIDTLVSLCEFVFIDRQLSIGSAHQATAPLPLEKNSPKVVTKKLMADAQKADIRMVANAPKEKFSFYDVLKEIKQSQQTQKAPSLNNVAPIKNQAQSAAYQSAAVIDDENPDEVSLSQHIKMDVSNIFSSLKNWKGKDNLNTDKAKMLADHLAKKQEKNNKELNPVELEVIEVYPTFEKSQVATREVFEAIALNKHIDIHNVHEALDGMVESIERNPDALMWLAKLKQTDNDAYNHAMNVSITMMALANFMSLPRKQVKEIGMAGLLQDIGKAKVEQSLLLKPGKVTAQDFEHLKKHVGYALDSLKVTENIPASVITAVAQHHERIDGSGYPNHLSGKQISLTGQLAGLVDTYCALTTDRVYAKGVYNQQALEVIHGLRNLKFSGVLIDQLVQFLGMYPVTSLVELNTGEVGVVIEQNSVRRLQPRVMILLNPDKTKNNFPTTINLMLNPQTPTGKPYKIVRGLPPNSYGLDPSSYYA
jgi:HD-GYP domain-containing protein (c-di-GMP phosphodiesterase class II)